MAEVKNAFIKSKMNKDLDARLIPQGEYRDAVNVQVSKSEGDDVGALENVLGNISIADFKSVPNLTCIGYFVNEFDNNLYLFFTDYTDSYNSSTPTYSAAANNFIYQCNLTDPNNSFKTILVQGAFLNFSTNRPIIGVNVLEDFLFFTDNRNQPRKININSAASDISYYSNEDQISVAKYYPYQCIEVIKASPTSVGNYETTMYDVSSVNLPDGTSNPFYNEQFPGDPQFLEDKFVRFSYRFKFVDGEYSLMAPFTQACFIPKQDGYFLAGDERLTFASTVVGFMENKVNKIDLQIPLPSAGDQLLDNFHVSEIDIIYKESDGLALQVVQTIPVSTITTSSTVLEYTYNSTKPYKTLPSSEITRVFDKVPVKAFGQEIISNRIVYSNFQDKHTPPSFITYQVGVNEKFTGTTGLSAKTTIEYPNHSLKQNRNYQVGVVLSDRYGRQSTVILSNDKDPSTGGVFKADTVYSPYRTNNDSIIFPGDSLKISVNQAIASNKSGSFLTPGLYNGNLNESGTTTGYNPLGWYSYKIVVKQIEQEYYNVYTNGAIKGDPYFKTTTGATNQNTSFLTLLNDNINKVPRDLSEVGPQDKTFRSSVVLFGRVKNTIRGFTNIGNAQFIPQDNRVSFTTNNIEDLFDLFDVADFSGTPGTDPITSDTNPYYAFFKSESNPFVAEFVTSQTTGNQFGLVNKSTPPPSNGKFVKYENLAILETAPTVSRLDLFYETSTSGLVSVLNDAVNTETGGATSIEDWTYTHLESFAVGAYVNSTPFFFENFTGNKLQNVTITSFSVIDDTGANRTLDFTLDTVSPNGDFRIKTNALFYYGSNAGSKEAYTFSFQVLDNVSGSTTTRTETGILTNTDPTINNSNTPDINVVVGANIILPNLSGVNGTPDTAKNQQGLVFSVDQSATTGNAAFEVSNNQVVNTNVNASGTCTFLLRLVDDGIPNQGVDEKTFTVIFDKASSDLTFQEITDIGDGSGTCWWFSNNYIDLDTNLPSTLGNTSTAYMNELLPVTSSSPVKTIDVCTGGTIPIPGNQRAFFQSSKKGNAFSEGAFYVYINLQNRQAKTGPQNQSFINVRYAVSYRLDSSQNWASALDINNQNGGTTGDGWTKSFKYDGFSDFGYTFGAASYPLGNVSNTQNSSLTVENASTTAQNGYGAVILAFDQPGEYRIITGNLSSTFGSFTQSINNNGYNCTTPPFVSMNLQAGVEVGDFYYIPQNAGGADETLKSANNNKFRYFIATSDICSSSFVNDGSALYAREPAAKYVTQLYTDSDLQIPASSISGTKRYRRMEDLSGNNVSNPEYTRFGAYTANFQNGLRTTQTPTPCNY